MFLRRHVELGAYMPHELCIEMSADRALVDASGNRVEPTPVETLSTFVHEYFHYLQNISTVSGFAAYHATQQLLAIFSHTVGATGESGGSGRLSAELVRRLRELADYLDLLEGDAGPEHDVLESIVQVAAQRRELPFGNGVSRLSEVTVVCEVQTAQGPPERRSLQLGLCVIEEGLAYEIDRIVATADGEVPGGNAPTFPYFVLRRLGEHLAPGIDRFTLLACGVLSLLTNDPAGALVDALRDLGERHRQGAAISDAFAQVEEALRAPRTGAINTILEDVEGLRRMHARRGAAEDAMNHVCDIFSSLLARRLDDPLWDVRPFAAQLDKRRLTELLHSVEPCLVLQRLPDDDDDPDDGDRPQHDLMLAFGKVGEAAKEMTRRALPVLQCQLHYVDVHLDRDEFVPSAEVSPKHAGCPFYRSCTLQLRRDHADVCKRSPWKIYGLSAKETCWYGAAVAATLGTVRLLSTLPTEDSDP